MSDAVEKLPVPLSTHRDVDDIDDIVRKLTRVVRSEVVAAALDEEELAAVLGLERLERAHVRADVLADCGVRASTCLDCEDARGGERLVVDQELLVFFREDVVRDRGCSAGRSHQACAWLVRVRDLAPMEDGGTYRCCTGSAVSGTVRA